MRELKPDVRPRRRWTGAAGIRAGNDDNIALRDEAGLPAGTTADSPMVDVFATIQGPWNGRSGFWLDGSVYVVNYFDADEFDQSEFRGSALYDWRTDSWRTQIGLHASAGRLGGDAFDRKAGLDVRVVRNVSGNASLDLRYTYDDVSEADSRFAAIAGSRHQFDARYRWYRNGHRWQLHYWMETNDRDDPAVSPDRHRFGTDYRFQPETGLGYELGIDLRNSDYGDIATPREEDLLTLRGALAYLFRSDWMLLLEFRAADNDSTDDTFSYDRRQITFGAIKLF